MANYYRFNDSFSIFARRKRWAALQPWYLASLNQINILGASQNERKLISIPARTLSKILVLSGSAEPKPMSLICRLSQNTTAKKWDWIWDFLGNCQQIILKLPEHLCKTISSNSIACERNTITIEWTFCDQMTVFASVHTFQDYLSGVVCLSPIRRPTGFFV